MRSRPKIDQRLIATIVGLLLATSLLTSPALAQQSPVALVQAVNSIGLTVADTDRSVEFYSKILTFEKVSDVGVTDEAYEHLQGVFGARLRITTLRAGVGPAIEFLEYLSPRDGRAYPPDHHANDLLHWQTQLVTGNAGAFSQTLRANKTPFVSPGVIAMPDGSLGFNKGMLVRDPDGHGIQLVER